MPQKEQGLGEEAPRSIDRNVDDRGGAGGGEGLVKLIRSGIGEDSEDGKGGPPALPAHRGPAAECAEVEQAEDKIFDNMPGLPERPMDHLHRAGGCGRKQQPDERFDDR